MSARGQFSGVGAGAGAGVGDDEEGQAVYRSVGGVPAGLVAVESTATTATTTLAGKTEPTATAATAAAAAGEAPTSPTVLPAAYAPVISATTSFSVASARSSSQLIASLGAALKAAQTSAKPSDTPWMWDCRNKRCTFSLRVFQMQPQPQQQQQQQQQQRVYLVDIQFLQGQRVAFDQVFQALKEAVHGIPTPAGGIGASSGRSGVGSLATFGRAQPVAAAAAASAAAFVPASAAGAVARVVGHANSACADVQETALQSLLTIAKTAKFHALLVENGGAEAACRCLVQHACPGGAQCTIAAATAASALLLALKEHPGVLDAAAAHAETMRSLNRVASTPHTLATLQLRRNCVAIVSLLASNGEDDEAMDVLRNIAHEEKDEAMLEVARDATGMAAPSGADMFEEAELTRAGPSDADTGAADDIVEAPPAMLPGYPLSKFHVALQGRTGQQVHAQLLNALAASKVDVQSRGSAWNWDCISTAGSMSFQFSLRAMTRAETGDIVLDFQHLAGDMFSFAALFTAMRTSLTSAESEQ